MIRHIWFDFGDTIGSINKDAHDKLRYNFYASATGRTVSPELIKEFEELYQRHERSNSAVFRSLGLPSKYWSEQVNSLDPAKFCRLANDNIPQVLDALRKMVPISTFSNLELEKVFQELGVDPKWFSHFLNAGMVKEPKPALDGFYKMIELSQLPPNEILYIGDDVGKDILPTKKAGIGTGLMWKRSGQADYCFEKFDEVLDVVR
ncbi:MAG: HAD family hydrolase [Candidatus Kerfeldbacteria bacterium]|nr:HAD family hydrolase [Candidatus Kerfeldbacteria bacterium]